MNITSFRESSLPFPNSKIAVWMLWSWSQSVQLFSILLYTFHSVVLKCSCCNECTATIIRVARDREKNFNFPSFTPTLHEVSYHDFFHDIFHDFFHDFFHNFLQKLYISYREQWAWRNEILHDILSLLRWTRHVFYEDAFHVLDFHWGCDTYLRETSE